MTNQEAIKIIQMERDHCASHNQDIGKSEEYHKEMQDMADAFDLAINVLKNNKCDNCDLMLKEITKYDQNTNTNPV